MAPKTGPKLKDTTATVVHTTGTRVWVRDDADSWIKAEVLKVDGDELQVRTEKGKESRFRPEDCPLQNPETRGVEVCRCLKLGTVVVVVVVVVGHSRQCGSPVACQAGTPDSPGARSSVKGEGTRERVLQRVRGRERKRGREGGRDCEI